MRNSISKTKFLNILDTFVREKYDSRAKAAKKWGVGVSLVNMILRGERLPTEAMLNDIGYQLEHIKVRYIPECSENKCSYSERYREIK